MNPGNDTPDNLVAHIRRHAVKYLGLADTQCKFSSPDTVRLTTLRLKGYYDKEIADKLFLSVKTVRTHLRNIYQKLHVRSRTEAVLKHLHK